MTSIEPILKVADVISFLTLIVYTLTLAVLIQTLNSQSKSAERTARMEMTRVLTEAFSDSEMFKAIKYFLNVSANPIDTQIDRDSTNNNENTEPYRHRIFTTLRLVESFYKIKPDPDLFTSLITPDIVEVTLCLQKLNDYTHDVNEPLYQMVYKVFRGILSSYLISNNESVIPTSRLQQTRRILTRFQAWDTKWGDEDDCNLRRNQLMEIENLLREIA